MRAKSRNISKAKGKLSGPGWIRTNDQSVMSRPLYR